MRLALSLVTAIVFASPAVAQEAADSRFALGAQIGTTGLGVEAQASVNRYVAVRGSADFIRYDAEFETDDVDYDGELDLTQGGAFVDVHPFANAFFVSAGAYFGDRQVDLRADARGSAEIGNLVFTPEQIGRLEGEADLGGFAPFLGLGYNDTFTTDRRWGLKALVGAQFGDDSEVTLRRTGGIALPAALQAQLDAELRNEERELENDAEDFKVFPVVQLGVAYKF